MTRYDMIRPGLRRPRPQGNAPAFQMGYESSPLQGIVLQGVTSGQMNGVMSGARVPALPQPALVLSKALGKEDHSFEVPYHPDHPNDHGQHVAVTDREGVSLHAKDGKLIHPVTGKQHGTYSWHQPEGDPQSYMKVTPTTRHSAYESGSDTKLSHGVAPHVNPDHKSLNKSAHDVLAEAILAKALREHVDYLHKAFSNDDQIFKAGTHAYIPVHEPDTGKEKSSPDVSSLEHQHARLQANRTFLQERLQGHHNEGHGPGHPDVQRRQGLLKQVNGEISHLESFGVKSGPDHHYDWMAHYSTGQGKNSSEAGKMLSAHTGTLASPGAKQTRKDLAGSADTSTLAAHPNASPGAKQAASGGAPKPKGPTWSMAAAGKMPGVPGVDHSSDGVHPDHSSGASVRTGSSRVGGSAATGKTVNTPMSSMPSSGQSTHTEPSFNTVSSINMGSSSSPTEGTVQVRKSVPLYVRI